MNAKDKHLRSVWNCMKQRCYNIHNPGYPAYGGRGIRVCDEWKDDFKSFCEWAWNHGYKDSPPDADRVWRYHHGLSIDRIDRNKGYSPENCQWITMEENCKKVAHVIGRKCKPSLVP